MLVLFESSAGFGLFKVTDEKKFKKLDAAGLAQEFATPESASGFLKLQSFYRFSDTTEAVAAASALIESKLSSELKSFLKKNIVKKELTDEVSSTHCREGGTIGAAEDLEGLASGSRIH